ncbi:membrane protein [Lacinutrix jangbogonensis]|uniref:membrane protein n=1 Tax=Lacinutrix jangbogonensis TaxID=1469557 RepID=UPI00053DCA01|nr:membrane protein [Lacinutrix jangbogonensis]
MIKKLVLVFIALFAIQSYAQETTASPYSFYGIGSLKFKGTVENVSMGGLSIYKDSIHINLRNPATYGGNNIELFNNESHPVKFAIGGGHTSTNLKTNSSEDRVSSSTFDYFALSIPLGKLGFGFGLLPYTAVGYRLETNNAAGDLDTRFRGEGGLNKAFLSFGYQLTDEISFGVDANYDFGNIQNNTVEFGYNSAGEPLQTQSRETNRSDLSGINFNFGVHYQKMITNKLELQSAITFQPSSDINSANVRSFSNITINSVSGAEFAVSTIEADLAAAGLDQTTLVLPSKLAFGAGIGAPRKWFAGVEYTQENTSEFSNALYDNTGTTFEDSSVLSLGGFFIPKYNSFSSYWKRVVYRGGLRFENTGLVVQNESIREFGISFGVGLPVGTNRNPFSNANFGFEIGKRGTTKANLIQENFLKFKISLSLNDRWFQKRKFD